jgi:hypothetical protein
MGRPGTLSSKLDAPELSCDRATNTVGRRAIAPRTLALESRIRQVDRQSPRGCFGWLCVTNNGDCLWDRLRA